MTNFIQVKGSRNHWGSINKDRPAFNIFIEHYMDLKLEAEGIRKRGNEDAATSVECLIGLFEETKDYFSLAHEYGSWQRKTCDSDLMRFLGLASDLESLVSSCAIGIAEGIAGRFDRARDFIKKANMQEMNKEAFEVLGVAASIYFQLYSGCLHDKSICRNHRIRYDIVDYRHFCLKLEDGDRWINSVESNVVGGEVKKGRIAMDIREVTGFYEDLWHAHKVFLRQLFGNSCEGIFAERRRRIEYLLSHISPKVISAANSQMDAWIKVYRRGIDYLTGRVELSVEHVKYICELERLDFSGLGEVVSEDIINYRMAEELDLILASGFEREYRLIIKELDRRASVLERAFFGSEGKLGEGGSGIPDFVKSADELIVMYKLLEYDCVNVIGFRERMLRQYRDSLKKGEGTLHVYSQANSGSCNLAEDNRLVDEFSHLLDFYRERQRVQGVLMAEEVRMLGIERNKCYYQLKLKGLDVPIGSFESDIRQMYDHDVELVLRFRDRYFDREYSEAVAQRSNQYANSLQAWLSSGLV